MIAVSQMNTELRNPQWCKGLGLVTCPNFALERNVTCITLVRKQTAIFSGDYTISLFEAVCYTSVLEKVTQDKNGQCLFTRYIETEEIQENVSQDYGFNC